MSEANTGPYVLNLSTNYEEPTDEIRREFQEAFEEVLKRPHPLLIPPPGCTITRLNATISEAQFDRLLQLLALTDQERGFVRAALDTDIGRDFWGVLADYLEENGKDESATKIREKVTV